MLINLQSLEMSVRNRIILEFPVMFIITCSIMPDTQVVKITGDKMNKSICGLVPVLATMEAMKIITIQAGTVLFEVLLAYAKL